ncbi:MAG TPA: nitroreductase family protein [Syntrophales bacterium]|nr:nitroreductase family protein [Syntrophales bacterium]
MSLLDELSTARRSIRKYRAEMPPSSCIEEMLRLALHAPSSGNTQPVRFIRINSESVKALLREDMEAGLSRFLQAAVVSKQPKKLRNWINAYYRFSQFMFDAPLLMALGTVRALSGFSRTLSENGINIAAKRWETDADIAVGLALQGFMLKGLELGLGTCILTAPLAFMSRVDEALALTDVEIKCFITIGFPAETPSTPKKKGIAHSYREL